MCTLFFMVWAVSPASLLQVVKVVVNRLTTLRLRTILSNAFVEHKLSKVYYERDMVEVRFALKEVVAAP